MLGGVPGVLGFQGYVTPPPATAQKKARSEQWSVLSWSVSSVCPASGLTAAIAQSNSVSVNDHDTLHRHFALVSI